jgi:hypothetical protein
VVKSTRVEEGQEGRVLLLPYVRENYGSISRTCKLTYHRVLLRLLLVRAHPLLLRSVAGTVGHSLSRNTQPLPRPTLQEEHVNTARTQTHRNQPHDTHDTTRTQLTIMNLCLVQVALGGQAALRVPAREPEDLAARAAPVGHLRRRGGLPRSLCSRGTHPPTHHRFSRVSCACACADRRARLCAISCAVAGFEVSPRRLRLPEALRRAGESVPVPPRPVPARGGSGNAHLPASRAAPERHRPMSCQRGTQHGTTRHARTRRAQHDGSLAGAGLCVVRGQAQGWPAPLPVHPANGLGRHTSVLGPMGEEESSKEAKCAHTCVWGGC